MNIFLVGMMGSGKSTVGKKLANILQYSFYDTDEMIHAHTLMPIVEIFDRLGEDYFRSLESSLLQQWSEGSSVVSTGGGVVCRMENMEAMKKNGVVIYLKVSSTIAMKRLKDDSLRPLLQEGDMVTKKIKWERLLKERQRNYSKSDHTVDANVIVDTVIDQIIKILQHEYHQNM